MNNKMPRTPFSLPLSGSARETEIRLRNIFSGPKKRPPLPFLILMFAIAIFCGNLVSCRQRPPEPSLVMETQYYDSYGNYVELPALALPSGQENEAVDAINEALNHLRGEYAQLDSRTGTDAWENQCLFYPSTTDRYLNLLFFRSQFTTDLNTGHVFSLVYDKREGTLVSTGDALALAGLNEKGLLDQVAEQMEPEMNPEGQGYQIALHNLTLEGFRVKADGQPVFYLTGRMDDVDDAVLDAVSGADQLFIWEDRAVTVYDQYSLNAPLVPAEETDRLDPPLWNQWYFAGEEPVGGFVDRSSPDALNFDTRLNEMALEYLRAAYDATVYLAADAPDTPQDRNFRLDSVNLLGTDTLEGELLGLYQINYSGVSAQSSGALEWSAWSPAYLVARMYEDGSPAEFLVHFDYYREGMASGDAIRQAVWRLMDLEVCLFRDGFSTPIGLGSWIDSMFPDFEPETSVFEEGDPIYWPGDYWENWSVDGGGDAGGVSALRYYSAESGSFFLNRLETGRTDMVTPRGIRVGATREEVLAAYPGLLSDEKDWTWAYPDDYLWYCANEDGIGPHLYFYFVNDVVYMIQMVDLFN
ncbi:hypothetical protein [Lawsonibacter sp. JLR.KK007]|uniref:hypothetical protein n=1 Tax=Lawsonibacter sp. JLR.KK007 TaxID=3114293 RepID=UPI002FF15716